MRVLQRHNALQLVRSPWPVLLVLPLLAALLALSSGRLGLAMGDVIGALVAPDAYPESAPVIWHVRLPRTLASLMVGAALAVAGAALQGLLRNPLASPQTVGVTSGAALGGTLAIVLGLSGLMMLAFAFAAGLVTVLAVIALARVIDGAAPTVLTVVLAGIVLGSLATAGTTLLQYVADPEVMLPQIVYWLMGSFSATRSGDIMLLALTVLPGVGLLWAYGLRLDLISGGEDEARALGLNIARDSAAILCLVALLGAASVAVAGVVGWVGLVVPHAARLLVGPGHRPLILASALIGAALLCVVDTAARGLTGAELPISALTALIGAPVFLVIMFSQARGARNA